MLSRVTRMYERDKNSPSVIIWSLGNEVDSTFTIQIFIPSLCLCVCLSVRPPVCLSVYNGLLCCVSLINAISPHPLLCSHSSFILAPSSSLLLSLLRPLILSSPLTHFSYPSPPPPPPAQSGNGTAHASMAAWLRARDPRRPVQVLPPPSLHSFPPSLPLSLPSYLVINRNLLLQSSILTL